MRLPVDLNALMIAATGTGKGTVWAYDTTQSWQTRGADISVCFRIGDVLGARVFKDGISERCKNGRLVGGREASGWTHSSSGWIGLETIHIDLA